VSRSSRTAISSQYCIGIYSLLALCGPTQSSDVRGCVVDLILQSIRTVTVDVILCFVIRVHCMSGISISDQAGRFGLHLCSQLNAL
jgi:hypothetical protein